MPAVDVATAALDAYIAQDLDRLVMYLAPSVVLDTTHIEGWPEAPLYHGHAGFLRFVREWLDPFEHYELGIEEQIEVSPGCVRATSEKTSNSCAVSCARRSTWLGLVANSASSLGTL
jgi:hypothetical protein